MCDVAKEVFRHKFRALNTCTKKRKSSDQWPELPPSVGKKEQIKLEVEDKKKWKSI